MTDEVDLANIAFQSDEEVELFRIAHFKETVLTFMATPIGRYLVGCAQQEKQLMKDEMAKLDPTSDSFVKEYTKLQTTLYAAANFELWLAEAISNGENAQAQLDQQE